MVDWILLAQRMPELMPSGMRFAVQNQGLIVFGLIAFNLVQFVLWIAMLVHAIRNPTLTDIQRITWVIVISVTQGVGAIIYLLIGRRGDREIELT